MTRTLAGLIALCACFFAAGAVTVLALIQVSRPSFLAAKTGPVEAGHPKRRESEMTPKATFVHRWYAPLVLAIALVLAFAVVGALPVAHNGSLLRPTVAQARSGKHVCSKVSDYPAAVRRWAPLVARYFPHKHGHVVKAYELQALAIIWAESDGNPKCVTGSCCGLFQINCGSHHSVSRHDMLEPLPNVRFAARIFVNQGCRWRPAWTTARGLGLR